MNSSIPRSKMRPGNPAPTPENALLQAFARLNGKALGIAVGAWSAFVVFVATVFLIIKNGPVVGPNLSLLSQYFIGFKVTWTGSFVGVAYGFVLGFILGWFIAFLRNCMVSAYLHIVKVRAQMSSLNDFLDNP